MADVPQNEITQSTQALLVFPGVPGYACLLAEASQRNCDKRWLTRHLGMAAKQAGLLNRQPDGAEETAISDFAMAKVGRKMLPTKKKTLNNVNRMFENKDLTISNFGGSDS